MKDDGEWITADEVAARLGVHRNTVLRRVKRAEYPCSRINARVMLFNWETIARITYTEKRAYAIKNKKK